MAQAGAFPFDKDAKTLNDTKVEILALYIPYFECVYYGNYHGMKIHNTKNCKLCTNTLRMSKK